jgi:hypothetical protein
MSFDDVADIVGELTCLRFFPGDKAGRLAVLKLVGRMAAHPDQVRWLVYRMLNLFDVWLGPRALRLVFCRKYKPRDGIDITGSLKQYPEGIPYETRLERECAGRSREAPNMSFDDVADIVGELTCLTFFPEDEAGRLAVLKLVGRMAANPDQVRWLVDRMLNLFDEWPGPRTLRSVFCQKYKPCDGVDITGSCEQYPAGIPYETRLEAPSLPALPPGHGVSRDPKLEAIIKTAVGGTIQMKGSTTTPCGGSHSRFVKTLLEIVTAPCDRDPLPGPTPQVITQADFDEVREKLRREKSDKELEREKDPEREG